MMDQKRLVRLVLALVVLAGASCGNPFPVPQWQYASAHSNPQAALEAVRQIYIAEFPQLDDPDLVPIEAAWANLKLGGQAKEQRCSYLIKFRIDGDYTDGMAFIDQRHPDPHGFGYLEFKHPTACLLYTCSPFTPSDITILTRSAQLEPVYAAYGVQPVAFKPNTADKSKTMSRSVPAKFIDACKKGEAFSFTGAVREVSTREYDGFSTPMYTARVHTSNGTKTVLLGPAWFVKQRSWTLSEGDEITIDGKTASFDGETHHVAQKVHLPSGDGVAHLWNNNAPRWSMN